MEQRASSRGRAGAACAAALAALALTTAGGTARAEDAADLVKQARAAWGKRAATAQARESVDLYERAIKASPTYEALWEGARAVYFLGEFPMERAPRAERVALYDKGVEWAKAAVSKRPAAAEGHFWLGTLLGVWGQARGIMKSLSVAGDIRREGERALEIDPNVECGGPYRLLGRWYAKVPRIAGGDRARALKLFEDGAARCPANDLGRLYLAEALIDAGARDRARGELEAIVGKSSPDPRFRGEFRYIKRQAQKMLDGL